MITFPAPLPFHPVVTCDLSQVTWRGDLLQVEACRASALALQRAMDAVKPPFGDRLAEWAARVDARFATAAELADGDWG